MRTVFDTAAVHGGGVVARQPAEQGRPSDAVNGGDQRSAGQPGMMARVWKRLSNPDPSPEVQEAVRAFEATLARVAEGPPRDG